MAAEAPLPDGVGMKYDPLTDPGVKKTHEQLMQRHVPRPGGGARFSKNPFGFDEGFYTYEGRHSGAQVQEYALDIILKMDYSQGGSVVQGTLWSFQMLCPKCMGGLLVQDRGFGGQHELLVHMDKLHSSQIEPGVVRPVVSALGNPISCDYSMHEVNGVLQPKDNIHIKCGWRGRLEYGKLLDDYLR